MNKSSSQSRNPRGFQASIKHYTKSKWPTEFLKQIKPWEIQVLLNRALSNQHLSLKELKLDIKIHCKYLNEGEVTSLTNLLINIHPSGPIWKPQTAL